MSRFFEWFDKPIAEAERTNDGKQFKAAGFELAHIGGDCTAWKCDAADGYFILITDSTGTDHRLGAGYAIDSAQPDRWLIGLHLHDGDHLESLEAATAGDAIAAAQRLEDAARQFSAWDD